MLRQPLDDSLVAIAMILSLLPFCSTLWTIIMSLWLVNSQQSSWPSPGDKLKVKDNKKKTKKAKEIRICMYKPCKKTGHMRERCFMKRGHEAGKSEDCTKKGKKESRLEAHLIQVQLTEPSSLQMFIVDNLQMKCNTYKWIIDSGMSAYMSCQWEWFKTYHPLLLL